MSIVIDLNRITYREYQELVENKNTDSHIAILCKVVIKWDWASDPSLPESYNDLGLGNFLVIEQALRRTINEALGK